MADAPELEFYQQFLDTRDRLKKALAGSNMGEVANKIIRFEESQVALRGEVRQLNKLQRLSGEENERLAGLSNDSLELVAEAKAACWKAGVAIYG